MSEYSDPRHYDLLYRELADDIPFMVKLARKYGSPVLELTCGTGRVTILLAREGLDVTGLDIDEGMLAHGRKKAEEAGVSIRWVEADCRDFTLEERFRTILFPFNSFSHMLDAESIATALKMARGHLAPEGRFILDIFNPSFEILSRDPAQRYPGGWSDYEDPDGKGAVELTESCDYDTAAQVNRVTRYFRTVRAAADGGGSPEVVEERTVTLDVRVFFPQEIDALLRGAGLVIEEKFGDYSGKLFSSDSPKQIIVCTRG